VTLLYAHELTVADDAGRRVLEGVSLHLDAGQVLGLAGGPGDGKTVLAQALAGTLPAGLRIAGGRILVGNLDFAAEPALNDGVVAFNAAGEPLRATLVAVHDEGKPPCRPPPHTGAIVAGRDLAALAHAADEIAVLCAGRIVERGPALHVLRAARHPYTRALAEAGDDPREARTALSGCPFRLACAHAVATCAEAPMRLQMVNRDHATTCVRWRALWPPE
jgi:ABC-type dipeptide/oligopeptide/nickel transport system ATPase component